VNGPAGVDDVGPLLRSKFAVPEPFSFMVPRARLSERLTAGVRGPVTVVTGPAGSGKTRAVATWVRTGCITEPLAWLTLEASDSRRATFWAYVVEALRRAGLPLFETFMESSPTTLVDQAFLVHVAAQLAAQPSTTILVLDDASSVAGSRWAVDLDFVLRHSDGRLRLVLIGRWDPPLPLYRYRLAGALNEIRSDELAFTEAETADLLTLHGIVLTGPGLASLVRHTEGWAAGLRLFAMALEGHDNAERMLATIGGNEGSIAEYFMGEVLRAQSADVREFMLKISVLDIVTAELAQLLTGRNDARRLLIGLERENVFVQEIAGRPGAYRYHRLFGELLRAELSYAAPDLLPELHRRAAGRLAVEGQIVEAVDHAVQAGDWDTAAAIAIEDFALGQLVLGGVADPLGRMFRALPDLVDSPEAALVGAAVALAEGETDRAAKLLARAEDLLAERTVDVGVALLLSVAIVRALQAWVSGEPQRGLDLARAALSMLARMPAGGLDRHPELRVLILAMTGAGQSWTGGIDAAVATLTEAAAAANTAGCESLMLDCLDHLALLEAYRGRLGHAAQLARQAIDVAERCVGRRDGCPVTAYVTLAWVAVEHYDVAAAWRYLRAADPPCGHHAGGLVEAAYAIVKSRLLRARGEFRGALNSLRIANVPPGMPQWLAREVATSRARVLIASGHPSEAIAALDRLDDPDSADIAVVRAEALLDTEPDRARQLVTGIVEAAGGAVPTTVNAWLIMASLAADRGEIQGARDALRRALRLADPESQRRQFREVGARLRRLLREDQELAGQYRALGHATPAAHPAGQSADGAQVVMVEQLSKRELEVLRYVEAMLPTEEIAGVMYVSINTVKTHVRSILRKLSASRRNEAVRRAREIGLI
jgi:LuxR family maltose regulon positive regulatory protein